MVLEKDWYIGAKVALSGINIIPEAGLYNGVQLVTLAMPLASLGLVVVVLGGLWLQVAAV